MCIRDRILGDLLDKDLLIGTAVFLSSMTDIMHNDMNEYIGCRYLHYKYRTVAYYIEPSPVDSNSNLDC